MIIITIIESAYSTVRIKIFNKLHSVRKVSGWVLWTKKQVLNNIPLIFRILTMITYVLNAFIDYIEV